jgi:hypothetical protein
MNTANLADLVKFVQSLVEENNLLKEEIHRLRLATALRQWRPQSKRRGAPKKRSVEQDLILLDLVEEAMKEWKLSSRMAVLRDVSEKRESKPPSPTKRRRQIETLNKRLSAAKRLRDSSNK